MAPHKSQVNPDPDFGYDTDADDDTLASSSDLGFDDNLMIDDSSDDEDEDTNDATKEASTIDPEISSASVHTNIQKGTKTNSVTRTCVSSDNGDQNSEGSTSFNGRKKRHLTDPGFSLEKPASSRVKATIDDCNHEASAPDNESCTAHSSNECFTPNSDWAKLHLSRPLLKALADLGFHRPTTIQKQAIPVALQGRDVLGTAQTGSGKTAAFLLPILERLCQSDAVRKRRITRDGPVGGASATKALVLLPTRELAVQCFEMLEALSRYTPITKILVTGGLSQKTQEMNFRRQPDIVVATPGRVLDILLNSPSIHIELLEIIVLDEADRLLEMGFKQECLRILSHCSSGRQTLLFSATLSEAIRDLALLSLRRPIRVDVSTSHTLPSSLEQLLIPVPQEPDDDSHFPIRESILFHLCFDVYTTERTVIFFRTKKAAHRAALLFRLLGVRHAELHGNLTQAKRLEALETFHHVQGVRFLLCSELAARGLDIPRVDMVVNVMVPPDVARYVHQVGRTARLGKKGVAVTLFSPSEKLQLKRIIRQGTKGSKEAPLLKRNISSEQYQPWHEKLVSLNPDVERILAEERVEREIRLAEMEAQKGLNMQLYEDEILSRPKKRWFSKPQQSDPMEQTPEQLEKCQRLLASYETTADRPSRDDDDDDDDDDDIRNGDSCLPCGLDEQSDVDSGSESDDSDNGNSEQTNRARKSNSMPLQFNNTFSKQNRSAKPAPSQPSRPDSQRSTGQSASAKNRSIKERRVLGKLKPMTAKQKASMKAQLPSRAVGSKIKRKAKPKRLRVTDDAYDGDGGLDTKAVSRRRRFPKRMK